MEEKITMILKDEEYLERIRAYATGATSNITISTFKAEITTKKRGKKLKEFFDLLITAANNGVNVFLLTNGQEHRGHIPDSNAYAIKYLQKTNVNVRVLPSARVCHAKLFMVDWQVAILGSHNLSVRSCHNNFEISAEIFDKNTIADLYNIFTQLWETAKPT